MIELLELPTSSIHKNNNNNNNNSQNKTLLNTAGNNNVETQQQQQQQDKEEMVLSTSSSLMMEENGGTLKIVQNETTMTTPTTKPKTIMENDHTNNSTTTTTTTTTILKSNTTNNNNSNNTSDYSNDSSEQTIRIQQQQQQQHDTNHSDSTTNKDEIKHTTSTTASIATTTTTRNSIINVTTKTTSLSSVSSSTSQHSSIVVLEPYTIVKRISILFPKLVEQIDQLPCVSARLFACFTLRQDASATSSSTSSKQTPLETSIISSSTTMSTQINDVTSLCKVQEGTETTRFLMKDDEKSKTPHKRSRDSSMMATTTTTTTPNVVSTPPRITVTTNINTPMTRRRRRMLLLLEECNKKHPNKCISSNNDNGDFSSSCCDDNNNNDCSSTIQMIKPILPLLQAFVELELVSLADYDSTKHNYTNNDVDDCRMMNLEEEDDYDNNRNKKRKISASASTTSKTTTNTTAYNKINNAKSSRKRKVHFSGFDGSSTKPPVDVIQGSHSHKHEFIGKLEKVREEVKKLIQLVKQQQNDSTFITTPLESLIGFLYNLSYDDQEACSQSMLPQGGRLLFSSLSSSQVVSKKRQVCSTGNYYYPAQRLAKAAEFYLDELKVISRCIHNSLPYQHHQGDQQQPTPPPPSSLYLESQLANSCDQVIRYILRDMFNPVPDRAPETLKRQTRVCQLVIMMPYIPAKKSKRKKAATSYALADESLASFITSSIKHVYQSFFSPTMTPEQQQIRHQNPAEFCRSQSCLRCLITKPTTNEDWDDIHDQIYLAGSFLGAYHGARFLYELFTLPSVVQALDQQQQKNEQQPQCTQEEEDGGGRVDDHKDENGNITGSVTKATTLMTATIPNWSSIQYYAGIIYNLLQQQQQQQQSSSMNVDTSTSYLQQHAHWSILCEENISWEDFIHRLGCIVKEYEESMKECEINFDVLARRFKNLSSAAAGEATKKRRKSMFGSSSSSSSSSGSSSSSSNRRRSTRGGGGIQPPPSKEEKQKQLDQQLERQKRLNDVNISVQQAQDLALKFPKILPVIEEDSDDDDDDSDSD